MGKLCFAAFFASLNGLEFARDFFLCAGDSRKAADAATIEVIPKKSLRFMTAYDHELFRCAHVRWFQHNQLEKIRVWQQFR